MDFVNFFVIVGLIVLFSNIQKRRKRARRDEQEAPAERQDSPAEETQVEESAPRKVKKRIVIRRRVPAESRGEETTASPSAQPAPNAEGGYDYEAFRKKLRKAWKMQEDGAETSTDGVYREAEKHDDCEIQKEMQREPAAKRVRDIPRAEAPREERRTAPKPAARPAPKAAPKTASVPRAAAARTVAPEKSVWEKKPVLAARAPKAAAVAEEPQRVWSEKDVRQWILYDAVFGEPRARRPWTPRRRA